MDQLIQELEIDLTLIDRQTKEQEHFVALHDLMMPPDPVLHYLDGQRIELVRVIAKLKELRNNVNLP